MSAADYPAFFSDDEELLNSGGGSDGGYAPAVPAPPDTSDLGVSSLAPPPDAQLGPPAVKGPSSGWFDKFLHMPAPDLGPSGSDGGGAGATPALRLGAPMPGPFGPYGPKGNLGPIGFRSQ